MLLPMGTTIKTATQVYTLDKSLTPGGMGNIYLGHSEYNSSVIVKAPILDHPDGLGQVRLQKLRVEAQILHELNELRNSHIVRYIDECDSGDNFFLFLEYLQGNNMKEVYTNNPVTEREAISKMEIILDTVSHLHKKNILHRDVNPKNLILERTRHLVLIDFGVAKQGYLYATDKENAPIGGTPGWSAPEQFYPQGFSTPSSDLYSVAATLFFMLVGEGPKKYMNNTGLRLSPRDLLKTVSRETSDVIRKAMTIDPLKRFQTALDMLSALKGEEKIFGRPHIILCDNKYVLDGLLDLGRVHNCDLECRKRGYTNPIDIPVGDEKQYIARHHARINLDSNNNAHIMDLGSMNRTAVKRGNDDFQVLSPHKYYNLQDDDLIALAYKKEKGPYLTFVYKNR